MSKCELNRENLCISYTGTPDTYIYSDTRGHTLGDQAWSWNYAQLLTSRLNTNKLVPIGITIAVPSSRHQLGPCNCKRGIILQSTNTVETNANHECTIDGMIIVYETSQSLCILSIYTSDPLGALDRGYKIPSLKTKPPHVHAKWQLDWGIVAMTRAETTHTANSQRKIHLNKDSRPLEN